MSELVWFRSYLEQLLRENWGEQELVSDADGDYPFRYGNAAVLVRAEAGAPMAVRVMARAAQGVKRTAKLLAELNEVTAQSRFGSVYWARGAVISEYALPASALDPDTLASMLAVVAIRADDIGPMITAMYGGHTPFASHVVDQSQTGEDAA